MDNAEGSSACGIEIKDVDFEENEKLEGFFTGNKHGYVRAGTPGYLLWAPYRDHAARIRALDVRSDDIWLITFPRSGSTWTQELLWLLGNDLNYERAAAIPLTERFPFLEISPIIRSDDQASRDMYNTLSDMTAQHFIKTHLPLSLAPKALEDSARVVYVARDPRDVAVSFYHFYILLKYIPDSLEFKDFWNAFKNNLVHWSPFFSHIKEAWEKRNNTNFLFLFYEELSTDLPGVVRLVAKFLGKEYSDEQYRALCCHLDIENFRRNNAVNLEKNLPSGPNQSGFIRKGKVGGWRDHFDEEMSLEAEQWIVDSLKDSDFKFH